MKIEKFNTIIFIGLFVITIVLGINSIIMQNKYNKYIHKHNLELQIYSDSINYYKSKCESYDKLIWEYTNCGDSLMFKVDSLSSITDSLSSELCVALFKLERIKYYNKIAANGNNITFLRGWINRTLNDE